VLSVDDILDEEEDEEVKGRDSSEEEDFDFSES